MPQLQFATDWASLVRANADKVRHALDENDIDLLFVNNVDNVRYLTGTSPVSGPGLVHATWAMVARADEGVTLFSFNFYVDSLRAKAPWLADVRALPPSMPSAIAEITAARGATAGRIGFDGYLPYTTGKALETLLPNATLVNADALLTAIRLTKAPAELAIIDRCAAIAEMGMKAALEACVEGLMEYEVAAQAEFAMRSAGAEGLPYSSVVTSGENAALMQELSTDRILRRGDLVLLDLGCLFEGYYVEFARTALVGDSPSSEQRVAYQTVQAALAEMVSLVRPGVQASALDAAGRQALREAGFGEWEPRYFIGHGIGMTHWEPPIIDASAEMELCENMVLCLEPGIHKPGLGGIRLEDVLVVTKDGHRVVTKTEFSDVLS